MYTIKNALICIQDPQLNVHACEQLEQTQGVSRSHVSQRSKRLIFIDYQPQKMSMPEISQQLTQQGITNRIVEM